MIQSKIHKKGKDRIYDAPSPEAKSQAIAGPRKNKTKTKTNQK